MKTLSILSTFLVVFSFAAFAQKPALVKDSEAYGRIPYVHTVEESNCPLADPGSCASHTTVFPAVPAGYRLVVTYVSALSPSSSGASNNSSLAVLLSSGLTASDQGYAAINLPAPACNGTSGSRYTCVTSGAVSFYVEPGLSPTIVFTTGSTTSYSSGNNVRLSVVGYLLSVN